MRDYRPFGRTELVVSAAGLGTEYLHEQPEHVVRATLKLAKELGVNYLDILFSFDTYRTYLANAIQGDRDHWILTVHLGCAETDGQFRSTRDLEEIRTSFADFLDKFETDHADVVMIQMVDSMTDLEQIMSPGGLYDLAQEYIQAGKAKAIGLSSHVSSVALKAAQSGRFDAIMFPFSAAYRQAEQELLPLCREKGIAFIAMKPFAGGRLVRRDNAGQRALSPAECIGFVLSTPGVTTCVPGGACEEHILENSTFIPGYDLAALTELTKVTGKVKELGVGECIYCGHCTPCSAGISIPKVIGLVDQAQWGVQPAHVEAYAALEVLADSCTACRECMERCPYGVDVTQKMQTAVKLLSGSST